MGVDEATLAAKVEEVYNSLQDQFPRTPDQIALVKKTIELHLVAFEYNDYDRIPPFIHENYKQHSALVGDGPQSIIDCAKLLKGWATDNWSGSGEPHVDMALKRIFIDGPFVIVQHHTKRWPGDRGSHVIDIYRTKEGKFAEHWESVMDIPETELKHKNGIV